MRKIAVLSVLCLFSFLFSGCTTFVAFLYGFSPKYYYSARQEISHYPFLITLLFDAAFVHSSTSERIVSGEYNPSFFIESSPVKNVLINKVIVYAGENEYSMLEKIRNVSFWDDEYKNYFNFRREDKLDVIRHTGLIDVNAFVDHSPDIFENESYSPKINLIYISFDGVSLLYRKHKEVKILYDFSVELTTGETITVKKEITAKLKKGYAYTHWGILPTA